MKYSQKTKSNITIGVITKYASNALEYFLDSLFKNLDNSDEFELLVLCDNPSWQTLKLLQERKIPYITVKTGHSHMNWNELMKFSSNDFVVCVNDDVVWGPNLYSSFIDLYNINDKNKIYSIGFLERNNGHKFNYEKNNLKSFNYDEFYNYCEKNKNGIKYEYGKKIFLPWAMHKEFFYKFGPFTHHTHRIYPHEIHFLERAQIVDKEICVVTNYNSYVYHFSDAGNLDNMPDYHLIYGGIFKDYRYGIFKCKNCGYELIRNDDGHNNGKECDFVVKHGYWLCENCGGVKLENVK